MDTFCIKRGSLLDKPTLTSLEHPQDHSIHCLVDVARCRDSGYEVLQAPLDGGETHCRVYKLDSAGNDMVLSLARQLGNTGLGCSTCGSTGTQKIGFEATITGTINEDEVGLPTLTTTNVTEASVGCGVALTVPKYSNCKGNELRPHQLAHGSLMLISWGFLLPLGVIIARFLRRLDPLWFKVHRAMQMTGVSLALIGFIIAVSSFNVFQAGYPAVNIMHGSLGLIVMTLGVLQPINAYFRPHEKGTVKRQRWEYLHKGSGYAAVCLGPITVIIGSTLVADDGKYFQIMIGLSLVTLFSIMGYLHTENKKEEKPAGTPSSEDLKPKDVHEA